ncbi:MAG: rhodanese-like domain-containing protein [Proteobacteria bacterium]|nr:rhodanese-like domain-containing protein [Pseudomonadota bacterium]
MKKFLSVIMVFLTHLGFGLNVAELSPSQVFEQKGSIRMIDVRTPEEFSSEGGHIEGAELKTLGPQLSDFLKAGNRKERIVFICRSGKRSAKAADESLGLGYEATYSMSGGMLEWVAQGLPTSH